MVGNASSASVGALVCGRAAVSPTQPVAAPVMANGFLYTEPDTWRMPAMARMGEMSFNAVFTVRSVSSGTR